MMLQADCSDSYGGLSMTHTSDDISRTLTFGHTALERIQSLNLPAYPRNYELLYNYATGYNSDFNKAVDETINHKGVLTEKDVELLHEMYISPQRFGSRYDEVGTKILHEIEQVMTMLDAASGSTTTYTESLSGITGVLNEATDRDHLASVIESLVRVTRDMQYANQELENRLSSSKQEIVKLQDNIEAIRTESLTDPLTMLSNRKYFDTSLDKALREAKEQDRVFTLLMMDIDHFKNFNDKFGHLTGDQVLRLVAIAIKHNVKGQDVAARYGGEEFAIILPDTHLRPAVTVADHIRRAVMRKELVKRSTGESLGRVTASVGVAAYRPGDTAQSIIERADTCLYAAKRAGRNRVVCETDPEIDIPVLAGQVA